MLRQFILGGLVIVGATAMADESHLPAESRLAREARPEVCSAVDLTAAWNRVSVEVDRLETWLMHQHAIAQSKQLKSQATEIERLKKELEEHKASAGKLNQQIQTAQAETAKMKEERDSFRDALMAKIVELNKYVWVLEHCNRGLADEARALILSKIFNDELSKEIDQAVGIGYWSNPGVASFADTALARKIRDRIPRHLVPDYLQVLITKAKTQKEKIQVIKTAFLFYSETPAYAVNLGPTKERIVGLRIDAIRYKNPSLPHNAGYSPMVESAFNNVSVVFGGQGPYHVIRFASEREQGRITWAGDKETFDLEIQTKPSEDWVEVEVVNKFDLQDMSNEFQKRFYKQVPRDHIDFEKWLPRKDSLK